MASGNTRMDAKLDYIIRELWILAWSASVQRAGLYKKDIKPASPEVRVFRESVVRYLSSQTIRKYKNGVSEEQHYKNIEDLN